tara:strand:- start:18163 stop:18813 length:651 start_codon:yes stop_codon:yes gene_type:complete
MTPAQIETAARQLYNSINDTFWSSSEIMTLIYRACLELYLECGLVIERTFSSSTVIGTREYAYPTNARAIKRIEYNGKKLFPISQRDDDSLTLQQDDTTATGEPVYYEIWDNTLMLRPTPSAVGTLTVYAHCEPQEITSTSVMEVPSFTHGAVVDFVTGQMAMKDKNFDTHGVLDARWTNSHIPRIKKRLKLNKRGDGFAVVQSEELLPHGSLSGQ